MNHQKFNRHLAYREFGDREAQVVLLCIPGILETQKSFDPLVTYVEQHQGCRLVTVDLCGRGGSDWLHKGDTYKMSVYLEDLEKLITHIHATHARKSRQLFILGTSMGGILAMNLASQALLRVKGLILNDVAMSISWRGLYQLFGKFEAPTSTSHIRRLKHANKLDPKLLEQIKLPSHIDIDYKFNLRGINFYKALSNFEGKLLLLRGENSELCTLLDQIELKHLKPNARSLEVRGDGHPVSYKPEVLLEIGKFLGLEKVAITLGGDDFDTDYHPLERYQQLSVV